MSPCTVYLLHAVGHADLGVPPPDTAGATDLLAQLAHLSPGDDRVADILRLRTPPQTTSDTAPLAAALAALRADPGPAAADPEPASAAAVHLVLVSTARVRPIADAIAAALDHQPDLYGGPITAVTIAEADSLDEADIAASVTRVFADRAAGATDRAYVVWGSGATQSALGALDAVIASGLPWSLIRIGPTAAPRHAVYDPTADLPVDPVVPLLRRWRYHDLLRDLADTGHLDLTAEQRRIIDAEADQYGQAHTAPTAGRIRAAMAAALMRGDGSSGFAVRVYVVYRYQELRVHDGTPLDLIDWARRRNGRKIATLGEMLRAVRDERHDPDVIAAKAAPSGRWLTSPIVERLNEMGRASAHELAPPQPAMLAALREHLAAYDAARPDDPPAPPGLGPLPLVPGDTICYLTVLGDPPRDGSPFVVEQIADAATDRARRDDLDPAVRTYLGVPAGHPVPVSAIVLGTASRTYPYARSVVERLRAAGHPAVAAPVADVGTAADDPAAFTEQAAADLLHQHLGGDIGAIVLIPTGPKEHVLTLLAAAQRAAAARGVPLFLRQLVTRDRDVLTAGTHRLPLRFGTDQAILTAASHALDIAELDTAGRLLGILAVGLPLSARAVSLSDALRCATRRLRSWPALIQATATATEDLTIGMIAERFEVWAALPGVDTDTATGMRAVVGACASFENSLDNEQLKSGVRQKLLKPMFEVRNRLTITHGDGPFDARALAQLVRQRTGGAQDTVSGLLAAMAAGVRDTLGDRPGGGPRLADLLDELRADVRRLRDAEQARRSAVRQHAGP
ncbi:hypothetical protein O7632_14510 [Solwaraspora sp. WMMD406]|uniref:hypothetical protein n=1 Tax=Solwaraspora sp. WMMD406 TaxID=3016095 RepID=UPI002416A020|nr:hypothetical protein [Solwaraspora sp. WMMD406]MDG4765297.1 hypothetical protein [Solwaraspora sp. WMMD406]